MPGAERLRDSTQIELPASALDGVDTRVEQEFAVTVRREDERVRIIGSPVAIKAVSDFLARSGVTVD